MAAVDAQDPEAFDRFFEACARQATAAFPGLVLFYEKLQRRERPAVRPVAPVLVLSRTDGA
jgi:hypothetical protein